MNLKDLLPAKDAPPEVFWALVVEKGLIQSGIWHIEDGKSQVLGIGTGIPWESDGELIEATDAALSSAIRKLPDNYPEPQKTVFGVPVSWIKDGEISPENLSKIKKLCTELSLTPMGFVVLPEAIAHLYKSEEGSPLNAFILKTGEGNLELSIFEQGVSTGSTEVSRSVSLVDDVVEGVSRFEKTTPPTRFIVYNGREGDLESVRQDLLQADWMGTKVGFLHTPQVETLNSERKVLATALAGGAEIGNATAVVSVEGVVGDGIVPENYASGKHDTETQKKEEQLSAESFGFALEEDVSLMKKEDMENLVSIENPIGTVNQAERLQTEAASMQKPVNIPTDYLARSRKIFHSFSKMLPKTEGLQWNGKKRLFLFLAILGLLVTAIFVLWWFVQSAKITIFVAPKRAEENVRVTFSAREPFKSEDNILPARILADKVSGEKTKSTTGTKLIGDKAKGTVQVANGNSAAINLSTGTILTSSSGFKFVTDKEASISGQILPGSPGMADVEVTAFDIGSAYNLAKGEIFNVGSYSKALVAATSVGDFTGGSSQQVPAVSAEDQVLLEEELKTELSQNIKSRLLTKVLEDEIFIGDLAAFEVSGKNFDRSVGEQAENLKLSLEINASGLATNRSNILDYAKGVLSGKAPSGYLLSNDQIDFRFTFVSAEEEKYLYEVAIGGNFLPDVNTEVIKKKILGKSTTAAKEYLDSIPGFAHADVDLGIKFPGPFKTIPRIAGKIVIDIRPE